MRLSFFSNKMDVKAVIFTVASIFIFTSGLAFAEEGERVDWTVAEELSELDSEYSRAEASCEAVCRQFGRLKYFIETGPTVERAKQRVTFVCLSGCDPLPSNCEVVSIVCD